MNLHRICSGAIASVNPFITGTVRYSSGSTTGADGVRAPTYVDIASVSMQVQALTSKDLHQLDGLNLNGTQRAIYLYGEIDGVVRSASKGGDLIVITSGINAGVWLVNLVLEQWPDWSKCAVVLQND